MSPYLNLAVLALLVAAGHATSRGGELSSQLKPRRGRTRALRDTVGEDGAAGAQRGGSYTRAHTASPSSFEGGVEEYIPKKEKYQPKKVEPDLPIKYFHVPNSDPRVSPPNPNPDPAEPAAAGATPPEPRPRPRPANDQFITTLVHYANPELPDSAAWPTDPDLCWDNIKQPGDDRGGRGAFRLCTEGNYPYHPPYQMWDAMWNRDTFLSGRIYSDEDGRFESDSLVPPEVYREYKGRMFGMFTHHEKRLRASHWWNCGGGRRGEGKRNAGVCSGGIGGFARKSQGTVVRMLSGQAPGTACNYHAAPCDDHEALKPDVKTALSRLDGFAFIGIEEHWELSICLFHDLFGGACLPAETAPLDPGDYKPDMRHLTDPYDSALYDEAKARFYLAVEERGLTPEKCVEICPHVAKQLFVIGKHSRSR